MSTFSGRFVVAEGGPGEGSTGLEGDGRIEVRGDGLAITGQRRRGALAAGLAVLVGIASMLVVVVGAVMALDAMGGASDHTKLGVGLGLAALVGGGMGAHWVLERALPRARVELSVAWPSVVSIRVVGGILRIVTTSRELSGTTGFDTARADALIETCERARRS